MDIKKELAGIKQAIEDIKFLHPGYPIYISVTKKFNDALSKELGGEDYGIRLHSLFDCKYSVSPFLDTDDLRVVGLFDYAQIIGQWNTFAENQYKLSHLFHFITNTKNNAKEEN